MQERKTQGYHHVTPPQHRLDTLYRTPCVVPENQAQCVPSTKHGKYDDSHVKDVTCQVHSQSCLAAQL